MSTYYVAAKWEQKDRVRELYQFLKDMGHVLTLDWTHHEKDDPGYPKQYAWDDVVGVKACQVFIGLFEDDLNYGGALVEMGIALGDGSTVIIIGHAIDSCLFVDHPYVIQFNDVNEFKEYMRGRMT